MSEQEESTTPKDISIPDLHNITFTYEPSVYKPKNVFKFETPLNIYKKPKTSNSKLYDEIIYPENITTKWSLYKKSKLNIFSKSTITLSALGKKGVGKTKFLLHLLDYDETSLNNSDLKGLGVIYPKNIVSKNVTLLELSSIFSESHYSTSTTLVDQIYNDYKINDMFIDYITGVSNIMLLVVNGYTFEDIQYINKIKNNINSLTKLFIIHNLKDKETINECEEYIQTLSEMFELEKLFYVLTDNHNLSTSFNKNYYREFFQRERDNDNDEHTVVHVLYAKDNTEAGNYYNPVADVFLKSQIASISNLQTYNVVKSINTYLNRHSLKIFNVQKKIQAIKDGLELVNINENDIEPDFKKHNAICYLDNEVLVFKFEIASKNFKLNIKTKRSKEYYFFWFKFHTLTQLKYLENDNTHTNKEWEIQVQIPIEDGDLVSTKRKDLFKQGNLVVVTYKFPPHEISSDEYI